MRLRREDYLEPVGRETLGYAEKREAILEAAVRLFNKKGVRGATLTEMAGGVQLGATGITYYFKKKDDLAAACFLRAIRTLDELFARAGESAAGTARLATAVRLYLELQEAVAVGRRAPLIAFDDIRALRPPQREVVFDAYTNMFRRVRALFQGDDALQLDRREQNARAHVVLSLLLWIPAWIQRYEPEDYGRVADRIIELLQRGFAGSGVAWMPPVAPQIAGPGDDDATAGEAFLRAATELVNERGYRGASVDKISARLNLTKGAFYHHNQCKDELIVTCFERTFEAMRRAQNAAAEGSGWIRLCGATTALVRHQVSAQGPLLRTSALHSVAEHVRHEMVGRMNRLSDRFASFIIDGIADGSILPVDPFVAGQMVNAMINSAAEIRRWVPGITAEAAPDLCVRPLLTGMLRSAA